MIREYEGHLPIDFGSVKYDIVGHKSTKKVNRSDISPYYKMIFFLMQKVINDDDDDGGLTDT